MGVAAAMASVLCLFAQASATGASRSPEHADLTPRVQEQVDYIISNQLSSGAILGPRTRIMPYFANNAAIGLVESGSPAAQASALRWMEWYLAHLNSSAPPNVPAYSVFDYDFDPATGKEVPTGDYDSVDSYASTALNLAWTAYSSRDPRLRRFVKDHMAQYDGIARLLTKPTPDGVLVTSGPDAGLTIAKPSYPIAYTMDNAEVYSGLLDFARLKAATGRHAEARTYQAAAKTIQAAMLDKLWNAQTSTWDYAYANPSGPNFYPGASAQLWPILYGVVEPDDPRAVSAWQSFNANYPTWFENVDDAYAWTSIGRVAQIMGDGELAATHLDNIHARYAPSWSVPTGCGAVECGVWYANEAGYFILVSLALEGHDD